MHIALESSQVGIPHVGIVGQSRFVDYVVDGLPDDFLISPWNMFPFPFSTSPRTMGPCESISLRDDQALLQAVREKYDLQNNDWPEVIDALREEKYTKASLGLFRCKYSPPEVVSQAQFSKASDVFGFVSFSLTLPCPLILIFHF
jgi:hypothetical protein